MNLQEFKHIHQDDKVLYSEDIVGLFLPLFKQLTAIYDEDKVANIRDLENLNIENFELTIQKDAIGKPNINIGKINQIAKQVSFLDISERIKEETSIGDGKTSYSSNDFQEDSSQEISRPVYLLGYQSYEQTFQHYDQKTELFICGLLMASFAFNLDFTNQDDVKLFVNNRDNLYRLNRDLHPTLLLIISQLTSLDRTKRTRETRNLVWKLENYKDYNTDYEEDILLSDGYKEQNNDTRNTWVLNKLKSRLFEISRRNKLLYFRSSSKFLNLTIASVPTVLYYEKVKEKDLFLWSKDIEKAIKNQSSISLNKYLQLNESGYIASTLDNIRSDTRKDLYEYGFSQLKLVIAFLNWYNFKENKSEKINSPLLIIPTTLKKKKGVEDQFVLDFNTSEAEINPVLKFYLKDLYDIDLPESIDLEKVSIEEFYETIQKIIESRSHGIELTYYNRPKIRLIQTIAKKKIASYNKRVRYRTTEFNVSSYQYSYGKGEYKPLGAQIFKDRILRRPSYLEYLINDDIKIESNAFSDYKSTYSINRDRETNPYRWEFDTCNYTLGNFNSKKMSLVRDYDTILDQPDSNQVFTHLFSDEPKQLNDENEQLPNFEDNFYVLNADATQAKAISKAKAGKSIIIQGPPGTGKSQTITNLIADFVSEEKRILFVCEKRAALDVVFARLKSQNLHHLASLVHDSQADKKGFIMNVKETYKKFIEEEDEFIELNTKREALQLDIKKEIAQIQHYHSILTKEFEDIGSSLFSFIDKIFEYRNQDEQNVDVLPSLNYSTWQSAYSTLNDLSRALKSIGLSKEPTQYPMKSISAATLSTEQPAETIKQHLEQLQQITNNWVKLSQDHQFAELTQLKVQQIRQYAQLSELMLQLKPIAKQNVFDEYSPEFLELKTIHQECVDANEKLLAIQEQNKNWTNKLNEAETNHALEQIEKLEGKFYSFLFPKYRKLKKLIKQSYNFNAHTVKPKTSSVLKELRAEFQAKHELTQAKQNANKAFNTSDFSAFKQQVEQVQQQQKEEIKAVSQYSTEQLSTLKSMQLEANQSSESMAALGIQQEKQVSDLQSIIKTMQANINTLPVLLPYLKAFQQLPASIRAQIQNNEAKLSANEKAIAEKSLQDLYNQDIQFKNATGYSLQYSIEQIQSLHKQLMNLNGDYLVELYKSKFKQQLNNSKLLAKQQDEQGKLDKKAFNQARKILENEFGKEIRYKSIRELKTIESRYILDLLKPIWLMSPLSVSDTLPVDPELFDVVIFDEASQITLEEGIPTIFRSNQAIIVGDEMQMPPTNFFTSSTKEKAEIEDEDEDQKIVIDADSMLTHATKKLEDVMLSWHYRSQHEDLIGFSNAAFYGGNLLTIPDQEILETDEEDDELPISKRLEFETISFHYQEDGIYSKRQNNVEANTIAEMVKDLLINKPELSIGIVAFSMQQQDNIERALTRLGTEDNQFAALLEEAYTKTEDDQHVGLFVKNLENVQGDERDVIIISVCYGYNERGKMLMNFGPINRKGGEKRLNVIFSRSKKHMAIVSSIHYNDITNEYNEGANYLRRFLQFSEAVSKGKTDLSVQILESLSPLKEPNQQQVKDFVLQEIEQYIQSLGYQTTQQVGLSKFKIALGVKDSQNPKKYCLGLLLDNAEHYQTKDVMDQYVLRPNLLKAFGWNIIQVYKKDWLEQPELIKEQIKNRLND